VKHRHQQEVHYMPNKTTMPCLAAPVERTITGAPASATGVEQSWVGTPGYPFAGVEQSWVGTPGYPFAGVEQSWVGTPGYPFAGEGDE
jgi:hypothetical protein